MKLSLKPIMLPLLIGLLIGGAVVFSSFSERDTATNEQNTTNKNEVILARVMMEYAEDLVREKKPSPPMSARFYAYVGSVYYEVLTATQNQNEAVVATSRIINHMYPDKAASTTEVLVKAGMEDPDRLSVDAEAVLEKYRNRQKIDIDTTKIPEQLNGEGYWSGENPVEPSAGTWMRWNVEGVIFDVPPPPPFKSEEHLEGLALVKQAAEERTSEEGAIVNFWGGIPGTEAPAGIWQNRLDTVTKDAGLTDEQYAYAQMILAQTLADSFMECWKTKYTYWTARPSMVDGTINLAMPNPRFPSYVSGHSTISRAAAEVLSVMLPQYRDIWMSDALTAKNSRLWAGIHYPYDNDIGADLGRQVGEKTIQTLSLSAL